MPLPLPLPTPTGSPRGRRRRAAAAVLCGGLATLATSIGAVSSAGAAPTVSLYRYGGADRYETARIVATSAFEAGSSSYAVLANGQNFPDALAGSYLAGGGTQANGGPIFLTQRDSLPKATTDGLRAGGTRFVFVLGGEAAVSRAVEQQLAGLGYQVVRKAGLDRYETAAQVALTFNPDSVGALQGGPRTALLAGGQSFAEPLAAGPMAFAEDFPMLLTDSARLSPPAADALRQLGIERVLVLGNEGAVSKAVEDEVRGLGVDIERISGADSLATAARIADYQVDVLKYDVDSVGLASGTVFADGLAAAGHTGSFAEPMLLTAGAGTLGPAATEFLTRRGATVQALETFGGPAAVSDAVLQAACRAVGATTCTPGRLRPPGHDSRMR